MRLFSLIILFCSTMMMYGQDFTVPEIFPTYQHELLGPMVGKWKLTYSQVSDSVNKQYGQGFAEIYFMLGGRVLVIHSKNEIQQVGYDVMTYIGWDEDNKEYYLFRVDNLVLTRIHLSGKYDEKKRMWIFEGKMQNKDKTPIKFEYKFERQNKLIVTLYLDEGKGLKESYKEMLIKQE